MQALLKFEQAPGKAALSLRVGEVLAILFIASVLTYAYGWMTERWVGSTDVFLGTTAAGCLAFYALKRAIWVPALRSLNRVDSEPWWLEWTAGMWLALGLVFVARAFLYEPFSIPSASMSPTLIQGDQVLVNKHAYGWLRSVDAPQRGDVIVFRNPLESGQTFIKRVIGTPGDTVAYRDHQLTLNGRVVTLSPASIPAIEPEQHKAAYLRRPLAQHAPAKLFEEDLAGRKHLVAHLEDQAWPDPRNVIEFASKSACSYQDRGVSCTVPRGHVFVLGDNRDDSVDSRFWGFVPIGDVVGRADRIWAHFGRQSRAGAIH